LIHRARTRDDALPYPEASRRTVDKNDIGRVESIGIYVPIWSPFRALASHLTWWKHSAPTQLPKGTSDWRQRQQDERATSRMKSDQSAAVL